MKGNKILLIICTVFIILMMGVGCTRKHNQASINDKGDIKFTSEITELEKGLSVVEYEGNYGFDEFLENGGASSDEEVIDFLSRSILAENNDLEFQKGMFGCSTLSVSTPDNEKIFGRNFDWQSCNALIVKSKPSNGYKSISTVNMDFINLGVGSIMSKLPDDIQTKAALYAPLDGMNEKGLAISVNMIEDNEKIEQNTENHDITTTTAIRLLLDKAANVDEAVNILKKYDMHSSMEIMIHFAIVDSEGNSVVVEYVDNEMIVTNTPVVTNFYLSEGDKYGIGTSQSHSRYEILMDKLNSKLSMTTDEVKDAMDSVSKENFDEFESTEWTAIFNQSTLEVIYYHRENYDNGYLFLLEQD